MSHDHDHSGHDPRTGTTVEDTSMVRTSITITSRRRGRRTW
ncbi:MULTISPECIES: hypothetical protein [Microbacterium]|nr:MULTISPECIES: hypothetical protein [unclassified Microbacterium]